MLGRLRFGREVVACTGKTGKRIIRVVTTARIVAFMGDSQSKPIEIQLFKRSNNRDEEGKLDWMDKLNR